jgi:hypothetical protein
MQHNRTVYFSIHEVIILLLETNAPTRGGLLLLEKLEDGLRFK